MVLSVRLQHNIVWRKLIVCALILVVVWTCVVVYWVTSLEVRTRGPHFLIGVFLLLLLGCISINLKLINQYLHVHLHHIFLTYLCVVFQKCENILVPDIQNSKIPLQPPSSALLLIIVQIGRRSSINQSCEAP